MIYGTGSAAAPGFRSSRPTVAVVSGGDAQRFHPARTSAKAIRDCLSALGYQPVLVQLGPKIAAELLAVGAELVIDATLDGRIADGGVQELCGTLDLPCVGSPASAHRASADKAICSAMLAQAGIAVPKQRVLSQASVYTLGVGAVLPRIARELGPRLVVKPRCGDAGLGVRLIHDFEAAPEAIQSAFNHDHSVIVESTVSGCEFTVLLNGSEEGVWAVGLADVFYDDSGNSTRSAAWSRSYAPVSLFADGKLQAVIDTARRAVHALGCAGLTKVDLIVDKGGTAWVFDVDCTVDWSPGSYMSACLASNHLTKTQLMAALLPPTSTSARSAA